MLKKLELMGFGEIDFSLNLWYNKFTNIANISDTRGDILFGKHTSVAVVRMRKPHNFLFRQNF